jgi:putative DNA primase/helicase
VLQALGCKTVRVAFDADADKNAAVARPLRECVKELQALGYAVELERWPADAGKGIDDALAAGRAADIEILTGPAALQVAEEIAAAAGVDDLPNREQRNEAIDDPHRLARLYVERHGSRNGQQTLRSWRDDWQRWDGAAYRVVAGPEIRAEITRLVKAEFDDENQEAIDAYIRRKLKGEITPDDDKGPPKCRKVTTGLVTNVAHALASECLLPGIIVQPTWLDGDGPFPAAEVLATAAGLLHLPSLTKGEPCLLPPTPALFSGNALPYGFDPAAECPEWLRFLGTLWPDDPQSIGTLGDWFGYCLLPDTRHHKLLMLIGPPRSGKGTIARVLRGTIGEQNLASPTLASLAGPFGLWPLLGKLVALIADARLSGRTDSIAVVERLLSISGEDPQDVARKNMPTLAGIPLPVRFVVMTNELPNMRDASGALTTRVILLRLMRSFRGREDKTLTGRLLRELPGILNWSIHGWQRLQERGAFVQPDSGQELLDDLQDLASPIKAFVDDLCIIGPEFETPLAELFAKWREWCERHGRDEPGIQEWFAKDLRAAYPHISKVRRRTGASLASDRREAVYRGIGWR